MKLIVTTAIILASCITTSYSTNIKSSDRIEDNSKQMISQLSLPRGLTPELLKYSLEGFTHEELKPTRLVNKVFFEQSNYILFGRPLVIRGNSFLTMPPFFLKHATQVEIDMSGEPWQKGHNDVLSNSTKLESLTYRSRFPNSISGTESPLNLQSENLTNLMTLEYQPRYYKGKSNDSIFKLTNLTPLTISTFTNGDKISSDISKLTSLTSLKLESVYGNFEQNETTALTTLENLRSYSTGKYLGDELKQLVLVPGLTSLTFSSRAFFEHGANIESILDSLAKMTTLQKLKLTDMVFLTESEKTRASDALKKVSSKVTVGLL